MPIAKAGSESVSKLMNKRCTGSKGVSNAIMEQNRATKIAAIFPDSKN